MPTKPARRNLPGCKQTVTYIGTVPQCNAYVYLTRKEAKDWATKLTWTHRLDSLEKAERERVCFFLFMWLILKLYEAVRRHPRLAAAGGSAF